MIYRSVVTVLLVSHCLAVEIARAESATAVSPAVERILHRLDVLERRNEELSKQVAALQLQNEKLIAQNAQPATPVHASAAVHGQGHDVTTPAPAQIDDWTSHVQFKGDFRFRHENIDNTALADVRARETIRARFGAAIKVTDAIDGEIAIASGGADPRGGSATLGSGSSRKEIGLDVAYMSWRPIEGTLLSMGKMRQPFTRPGLSAFFDNEIRPEGVAVAYTGRNGVFGSAFRFWLEERSVAADSMLNGVQAGWQHAPGAFNLKVGAGYYDYDDVEGRFPGFGDGVVNQLGNSVVGEGPETRYAYDYNIGQIFVETSFAVAETPFSLFADYARNMQADNGLNTAWNLGVLFGKADRPGRWEVGVLTQRVEKDALFGQWIDSDFAGGVTDNQGQLYRLAWMSLKNLFINVTYLDTKYNVDLGAKADYDRWQLDFNFIF